MKAGEERGRGGPVGETGEIHNQSVHSKSITNLYFID